jgi:G:T/U-mismatch repair DNA glycosylase
MLVLLGFGFTDVAKRPTVGASDLEAQEFEQARERLTALIIAKKPRTVVFVSKVSARAFLGEGPNTQIKYGQQTETYHGATIWFVPSTSGQSYADTTYEEKLALFRQLSKHIKTYFSGGEAVSPSISSPALQASASRRFFGRQTSLA